MFGRGQPGDDFCSSHVPGAGSIARPVDKQSRVLPLYYEFPSLRKEKKEIKTQQINIILSFY